MDVIADQMSLRTYLEREAIEPVRLHLGCGGQALPGFVNVDLYPHDPSIRDSSRSGCVADAFADMRNLGLPDGSVAEIFTSHTLEHFPRWEALDMLADWFRICQSGARVIIETPRFWSCVVGLFCPVQRIRALARTQFYGNQQDRLDYETHRYVWSGSALRSALLGIGFSRVSISWFPKTHCRIRDMRAVAIK